MAGNMIMDLLYSYYFLHALLPFFLVFTIVFAVLQKSEILGKDKKNLNVMISAILGLMVVIPHLTGAYPRNADVVAILLGALPNISVVVIAIMMALLILGVFGAKVQLPGGSVSGYIVLLAFGIVVYVFGAQAGLWDNVFSRYSWWGYDTTSMLIVILIFAIIVWYITKDEKSDKKTFGDAIGKIGDLVKGK